MTTAAPPGCPLLLRQLPAAPHPAHWLTGATSALAVRLFQRAGRLASQAPWLSGHTSAPADWRHKHPGCAAIPAHRRTGATSTLAANLDARAESGAAGAAQELAEMTERDWRIFREDFSIAYKGVSSGMSALPIRNWKEATLPPPVMQARAPPRRVRGAAPPTPRPGVASPELAASWVDWRSEAGFESVWRLRRTSFSAPAGEGAQSMSTWIAWH